jgi:hypothetical protein
MAENPEYSEAEIAADNRKTSAFCRYKKTHYLAAFLLCLFIAISIVCIVALCSGKKTAKPAAVARPQLPPLTSVPTTPQADDFLQTLLAQIQ